MTKKDDTKIGRPPFPDHLKKGTKSVRVNLALWSKAQRRAKKEGFTIQDVVREFTEGYARGELNMPKLVKKYDWKK